MIATRFTCYFSKMALSNEQTTLKGILGIVRGLAAANETNVGRLKMLSAGQKSLYEKVMDLEALVSSGRGASDKVSASSAPTIAGANLTRLEGSTSLLLGGLFTGTQIGDSMDGQKRASVYFRILTVQPYPKPSELKQAFLEARRDVTTEAVIRWFDVNRVQILARFRDRRSALVRHVKLVVATELKVGRPPEEGEKTTMDEWRHQCTVAWLAAKDEARSRGLFYPEFVTTLLMNHAETADPYVTHVKPFVLPVEVEQGEEPASPHQYESLEGMEAYWLIIIAVSFERTCVDEHSNVQCSKGTVNSTSLGAARAIVCAQRAVNLQHVRDQQDNV
jgi:hypothetical protein